MFLTFTAEYDLVIALCELYALVEPVFSVNVRYSVPRPTSCSAPARSGLLRGKLGAGEAGLRSSSSAESAVDMASPGFSLSPAAEKTTITLGRGSVRRSCMNRLTRVVAAGSGLKDCRSLLPPSEPLEPLEPFCCMRAASRLTAISG